MRQKEKQNLTDIVKLWKRKGVDKVILTFSCGGDSMGDTEFEVFFNDGESERDGVLVDYFESVIYDHVEFYVNSDGHYEGESGTVEITLEEDEFVFSKYSQSEWNESASTDIYVNLTPEELAFLKEYVSNINGGESEMAVNYKHDFILTTELETIADNLEGKIRVNIEAALHSLDIENLSDWYTFTTNDEDEMEIEGKTLKVVLNYSYTEYKDED